MEKSVNMTHWYGAAEWTADDLSSVTNRIEAAKEQSGCSTASVMEIIEILEQLEEMRSAFPLPQQRYFAETANELIGLAVGHLERLRADLSV